MFDKLPDEKLLDAYVKAVELQLERNFIHLLRDALVFRGIKIPD
ncbi:sporulation histidine kinase inhibitor Sda [Sediminibacillus albus]|uniref:Sporulation inhibitor A n=1 Tax=Sediminibacillus albus TaxID=407036 RepID=A0A1G9B8A9_9BACI|nr:sporulation histidine kinase inhibitor Sda [Sediminibacillus albus]SDK35713.1 Sporulation inhibitor A [Sediminibacillus albus]